MKADLMIAVREQDAARIAKILHRSLGMTFSGHDSSYKGEYFLHVVDTGSRIEVGYNEDPMFQVGDAPEEQYFEADYKEFRVLISAYVSHDLASKVVSVVQDSYPDSVVVRGNNAQPGVQADRP